MPACAHCNAGADLKCSACGLVYYCGKEHQKAHWRAHKAACCAYRVETSDQFGRYLVANRDIRAGSVIVKKAPLVVGPKMISAPVCLGCHARLTAAYVHCMQCGWELCDNATCAQSPWHVHECKVLAGAKPPAALRLGEKSSRYAVILPLRAILLRTTNPKAYDELLGLQSHLDANRAKPIYDYLAKTLLPQLAKLHAGDDVNALRICSIFDTNAFEVRHAGVVNVRAVYPVISFLRHDCTPNTRPMCDASFAMSVVATCDIPRGAPICTTYTQTLWPTAVRRAHLRAVKHFECVCARCVDATELGTHVGAMVCQACGAGLLVSTDPLDSNASWRCDSCADVVAACQVETLNAQIRKEIVSAERSVRTFETLLAGYAHLLHATNTHVLEIKYALVQLYECAHGMTECHTNGTTVGGDAFVANLRRRVELCQDLLKVSRVLEPGCSSFNETLENSTRSAEAMLATVNGTPA